MRKKFIVYFIGNFGSKFLNLLMIPIFTIFINPKEFGSFDYWLTISNLLVVILGLNFHVATYLDIIKREDNDINYKIQKMLKFVLWQSIFISLMFTIHFLIFGFSLYIFLIYLIIIFNNIYEFLSQGILRGLEKNKNMAVASFLFAFSVSTITLIFILSHEKLNLQVNYSYLLLLAQLLGFFITNIYIFISLRLQKVIIRPKSRVYLSYSEIKKWMTFSIPMVLNALSWWVIYLSGRVILVNYLGVEENGIYSIASRFPSIIYMLNIIFSMVWQDRAIELRKQSNKSELYTAQLKNYINIQFISLILLTIILRFVLPFILKNEYIQGMPYIPLLTYATVLAGVGSFYAAFYYSTENSSGAIYSSLIGTTMFILIAFLTIEYFKVYAIALSMMIGYFSIMLYRVIEFRKKINIYFPVKTFIMYSLIFVIVYSLFY
ncbi:lipopolysaccharide biosynthesis protein [Exiguobacterium sp. R-17]|uniref:lipopolysaccharide biosynthesis protein n=1 Tax=Exiguobacterium sp. R-17 TaxID=3404054 RepID=UPI003CEBE4FF